jgi:hypothetical protein
MIARIPTMPYILQGYYSLIESSLEMIARKPTVCDRPYILQGYFSLIKSILEIVAKSCNGYALVYQCILFSSNTNQSAMYCISQVILLKRHFNSQCIIIVLIEVQTTRIF